MFWKALERFSNWFENFRYFRRTREWCKCYWIIAATRRSTDSCTGLEATLNKSSSNRFFNSSLEFTTKAPNNWKRWFSTPVAAWTIIRYNLLLIPFCNVSEKLQLLLLRFMIRTQNPSNRNGINFYGAI